MHSHDPVGAGRATTTARLVRGGLSEVHSHDLVGAGGATTTVLLMRGGSSEVHSHDPVGAGRTTTAHYDHRYHCHGPSHQVTWPSHLVTWRLPAPKGGLARATGGLDSPNSSFSLGRKQKTKKNARRRLGHGSPEALASAPPTPLSASRGGSAAPSTTRQRKLFSYVLEHTARLAARPTPAVCTRVPTHEGPQAHVPTLWVHSHDPVGAGRATTTALSARGGSSEVHSHDLVGAGGATTTVLLVRGGSSEVHSHDPVGAGRATTTARLVRGGLSEAHSHDPAGAWRTTTTALLV